MIMKIAGLLITGGAIYGGIRADLRAMHERISDVKESAALAHRRLDQLTGVRT
ncbi:hypothetical protein [Rhodocyclus gracilis]|uniref:Uncharacterized protein n=1 Tax=Rhodocyclus tenuis TaxID=1066 RepID=A0A6L5JUR3_RHOTE|nr:hypothetical protein [Rhodocyclus gracilis]MQY50826.1 hypothetical protein [Rhodocyclus gracilis]